MKRRQMLAWLGAIASAEVAVAGIFGNSAPKEQPTHKEKKTAIIALWDVKDFERVVGIRQERLENKRVLSRYLLAMQKELKSVESVLENKYGMSPGRKYVYNPTNTTIYYIANENNKAKPYPHRVFPTKEDSEVFLQTLNAKSVLLEEVNIFTGLVNDNEAELKKIALYVSEKGGISNGADFRYDKETHEVFELIPLPRKVVLSPEEKALEEAKKEEAEKAKKLAEKKAREEEEARIKEEKRLKKEAEKKAKEEAKAMEELKEREAAEAKRRAKEMARAAKEAEEARIKEEKRLKKEAEKKAKEAEEARIKEEKRLKKEAEERAKLLDEKTNKKKSGWFW